MHISSWLILCTTIKSLLSLNMFKETSQRIYNLQRKCWKICIISPILQYCRRELEKRNHKSRWIPGCSLGFPPTVSAKQTETDEETRRETFCPSWAKERNKGSRRGDDERLITSRQRIKEPAGWDCHRCAIWDRMRGSLRRHYLFLFMLLKGLFFSWALSEKLTVSL